MNEWRIIQHYLMRKTTGLPSSIFNLSLVFTLTFGGCAPQATIPLPKGHPASGFYETARAFNVSSQECSKLKGSIEIRPDKIGEGTNYEKIRELAPGLFLVKQKSTGKQFVTVLFMEYGLVASLPRTCSWDTAQFPISPSKKTIA